MKRIAVIGLGNMGAPMAANLVKAGYQVAGHDLQAESCATAAQAGVDVAATGRDAVADADLVLTMLPAGKHVLAVYTELLPAARPGTLFVDCSTIDVSSARGRMRWPRRRGTAVSTRRSPAGSSGPRARL